MCQRVVMVALAALFFGPRAHAENWPGWRGPTREGLSAETEVPLRWGPDENVVWKTPIPGRGHASPIVFGDSVFVVSAVEADGRRLLLRVDRDSGKIVWQRTVLTAALEPIHRLNSYASSTPATDGKRIFVTFLDDNRMFVAAYDFDGKKLWETRPGEFYSRHGFCTCPVLYEDKLILNGDHDGDSYLVMLRQRDGSVVWKTPRENKTRSYSTPIIVPVDGKDQLMLTGSLNTAGFDVQTGKRIWFCDGPSEQMVASLLHGHGLIFSMGGFPDRHLLAIREGGVGDVTDSHIVWRTHEAVPYVPSALLYGDLLHVISDAGIYSCYEATTGKLRARKRAVKHTSGSLVGACGRVYITDDHGTTLVLKNGPDFEKLATNHLGEEVYSSLAISQGSIFIRGVEHLYRIGTGK